MVDYNFYHEPPKNDDGSYKKVNGRFGWMVVKPDGTLVDMDGNAIGGGSSYTDENAQDAVGGALASGLAYDDANNSISMDQAASGQVSLTSGTAVVDTGISATDATFQLAIGVDDPNADCKLTGRLFWDDSAGTYKVEIVEDGTSVGNPTANYDVIRVR